MTEQLSLKRLEETLNYLNTKFAHVYGHLQSHCGHQLCTTRNNKLHLSMPSCPTHFFQSNLSCSLFLTFSLFPLGEWQGKSSEYV